MGQVQQMMQNPQMMQQMMQMMGQMQQGPAQTPGTGPAPSPIASMMQNPQMMQQMMQMMGGAAPPAGNPTQPAGPMDEAMQRARFGPQLAQLMAMGFDDEARCLAALLRCNGNVDTALDQLLS